MSLRASKDTQWHGRVEPVPHWASAPLDRLSQVRSQLLGVMLSAPLISEFALKIGPPEFFSLMLLGLTLVTYISHGPVIKALMMAALGLVLGTVGLDNVSGLPRFTLGIKYLLDGVPLVPFAMGLFGISEILVNLEETLHAEIYQKKIDSVFPTLKDWTTSIWAILRGTVIGFFLGLLPGAGPVIASFASYGVEKRVSKYPEKFGTGVIEGVAGPESANNAAAQSAFIPLFTLGIPATPAIAILLGAFVIHGIQPGPAPDLQPSGCVLGSRGKHVYRKCDASGFESSHDWTLGKTHHDPLCLLVPAHSAFLPHRGFQYQLLLFRCLSDVHVRHCWLFNEKVQIRRRLIDIGLYPGTSHGENAASIAYHVPRRLQHIFSEPHFLNCLVRSSISIDHNGSPSV